MCCMLLRCQCCDAVQSEYAANCNERMLWSNAVMTRFDSDGNFSSIAFLSRKTVWTTLVLSHVGGRFYGCRRCDVPTVHGKGYAWSYINYVWYCSIGADRFGWCELFIRRADRLLLYHSSSADIPAKEKYFFFSVLDALWAAMGWTHTLLMC